MAASDGGRPGRGERARSSTLQTPYIHIIADLTGAKGDGEQVFDNHGIADLTGAKGDGEQVFDNHGIADLTGAKGDGEQVFDNHNS